MATTGTLSRAQLEALVAQAGFPAATRATAVAVALAESTGNTGAISSTNDYGLWQINAKAHPQYNTRRLIEEPAYNAAAAFAISSGGTNWTPWVAYKTGAYRRYLAGGTDTGQAIQGAAGFPNPIAIGADILGKATGADAIVEKIASAALGLLLSTAGLALMGLGLYRLTSSTGAVDGLKKTADVAGTATKLIAL